MNPCNSNNEEEALERFGDMVPYGDPTWYQEWHSPYYNQSHADLRCAVREFIDREVVPWIAHADEKKDPPKELCLKIGEVGITACSAGLEIARNYFSGKIMGVIEPKDLDRFHCIVVGDELARVGCPGLVIGLLLGPALCVSPLHQFASDKLKQKIIPEVLSGKKRMALAITEPQGGSDVANLTTEAKLNAEGTHYIVNGTKKWITGGTDADYFLTAVRTGGKGMKGISLVVAERSAGVKTRPLEVMGLHGSGTSFVTYEDVLVPVGNLVGELNDGFKPIVFNFNHERMGMILSGIRYSRVCYEESFKYANKRKTFGKKLIEHAVIREKLAHMIRQIEATQHWAEHLAYQSERMPHLKQAIYLAGPISLLKVQVSRLFEFCAREACQIFGGAGYTKGGQGEKIERLYRDVRGYAIPGGSEEIMADLGVRMAMKMAKMNDANL